MLPRKGGRNRKGNPLSGTLYRFEPGASSDRARRARWSCPNLPCLKCFACSGGISSPGPVCDEMLLGMLLLMRRLTLGANIVISDLTLVHRKIRGWGRIPTFQRVIVPALILLELAASLLLLVFGPSLFFQEFLLVESFSGGPENRKYGGG